MKEIKKIWLLFFPPSHYQLIFKPNIVREVVKTSFFFLSNLPYHSPVIQSLVCLPVSSSNILHIDMKYTINSNALNVHSNTNFYNNITLQILSVHQEIFLKMQLKFLSYVKFVFIVEGLIFPVFLDDDYDDVAESIFRSRIYSCFERFWGIQPKYYVNTGQT